MLKCKLLIFAPIMLFLANCSGDDKQISVKDQWVDTISNYGLLSIYPMREDVHVGDIRLFRLNSDSFELGYRNIGRIDAEISLKEHYKDRPRLPATAAVGCVADKDGKVSCPGQPSGTSIFSASNDIERPRYVALPAVEMAALQGFNAGARAPLGGIEAALGLGGESSSEIKISLGMIETIELDDTLLYELLANACNNDKTIVDPNVLAFSKKLLATTAESKNNSEGKIYLGVISSVYYARSIDYTFTDASSFAASLTAVTEGLDALKSLSAVAPPDPDSTKPTATAGIDTSDLHAQAAAAQAAADRLRGQVANSGSPGLSASYYMADGRGLTLREVFERPMAFAGSVVSLDADRPCEQGLLNLSETQLSVGDGVPLGGENKRLPQKPSE